MNKSLFLKYILPFAQWYGFMICVAILIDYFLHKFNLVFIGRYFGLAGTPAIVISFLYSLRKRKIIKSGSPKGFLLHHEYFAWAGSILLLVHAGIHFNATLPWLAIFMMLIVVASGLAGKFLFKKANESFNDKKQLLLASGLSIEETEKKLFFDTITVDIIKKWRDIHLPITIIFGILCILHIMTIIIFGS